MMKQMVTAAVAALTLGGAAVATATPASAQGWRGGGWHGGGWHGGGWGYRGGYRGWGPGAAVGAGILGLAVGAAIADHPHYYAPAPDYAYDDRYGYAPCGGWRWDPYVGHYVRLGYCY